MPVNNVSFKNIEIGGELGIEVTDAKNITLDNLSISNKTGSPVSIAFSDNITINKLIVNETAPERLPIILDQVNHLQLTKLKYHTENEVIRVLGKSANVEVDRSVPESRIVRGAK